VPGDELIRNSGGERKTLICQLAASLGCHEPTAQADRGISAL